jgi:hypothetical protein
MCLHEAGHPVERVYPPALLNSGVVVIAAEVTGAALVVWPRKIAGL